MIGVQFEALLDGGMDSNYFSMAAHANQLASELREGLSKMNVRFYSESQTNQVFPILPAEVVRELEKDFFFYEWAPEKDGMIPIRLVTAWGTEKADIREFLEKTRKIMKIMV